MARKWGASQARNEVPMQSGPAGALAENPESVQEMVAELERQQPYLEEDSKEAVRQKIAILERRMEALTAEVILQRQIVAEQVTPVIQYLERTIAEVQSKGRLVTRFYNRLAVAPVFKRKLKRARGILADAASDLLKEHERCKTEKEKMERDFGAYVEAHKQLQTQRLETLRGALEQAHAKA